MNVEDDLKMEEHYVFEFEGEFENFELFNGKFNEQTLEMCFPGFTLSGERIFKNIEIWKKEIFEGTVKITRIPIKKQIIVFRKPPRYRIDKT